MGNRLVYEIFNQQSNNVYYVPISLELENDILYELSCVIGEFYNKTDIIIGDSVEKLTHSLSPDEFIDYLYVTTRKPCSLVIRSLDSVPDELTRIFSKPDGERYFLLKQRAARTPEHEIKLAYLPFFPLQEIILKCSQLIGNGD